MVRAPKYAKPRKSANTEAPLIPAFQVHEYPTPEKADVVAIQALAQGVANQEQQKRALRFIVYGLSQAYDWSFRPAGDRETCVMLGRQFVGQQIVFIANATVQAATKKGASNDSSGSAAEQGRE